jgi:uncharacterized protein (TIGR01777 family)
MKVVITGGGGFVGTHLTHDLLEKGHHVLSLGTTPPAHPVANDRYRFLQADTSIPGTWQDDLEAPDAVINLAGKTIFNYWTSAYKEAIYHSRVDTTKHLVEALPENQKTILLSASAAGFYGNRQDDVLDETQSAGNDFLATVCQDWESEANRAARKGMRTITARLGVVLGRGGGAMSKMLPAFRFFVGGPIGNGRQWFPWIHIEDLISAIQFVLSNDTVSGPVNFCGVQPATNRDLARTLGKTMKRPSIMPAPAFMVRLVMGELGNAVLFSQRTVPAKLLSLGFTFKYPTIQDAVSEIVKPQ